jgi:CRP-like cAMP-binding protein
LRPTTNLELAVSAVELGSAPEPAAALDPRLFLEKLATGKTSQEYRAGEFVFSQGDAADAVFYIQSGKVKLTVVSKRGKEAVLAVLPEGSFFGESCLTGRPLRMATASAVQRATIVRVTREAMVKMLHQEPEFAETFLAYVLSRNIRMEADLVDHLFKLQRKTPRPSSPAAGQLWPGIEAHTGHRENEPGNPRRNDWHHALARQFLSQPVPGLGLHRL